MKRVDLSFLSPVMAAIAFVGFVAAFVLEIFSYQHAVIDWAKRDLQSRTDLAAANLEEPLKTQDFRKIHEFGAACVRDGVRLTIASSNGGRVYDTQQNPEADTPSYLCTSRSGEWKVTVSVPSSRVLAPFFRAMIGFALAGLMGMAGVILFFLVTYRQRVKIRELARVEKFRREFIADVSHEIKTPLTGILGAADLLGDDAQPPDVRQRLIAMVKSEAARLNSLVQSILSLARLEREGEVLKKGKTDVAQLVREIIVRLELQANESGLTLTADGIDRPLVRELDAQLIGQALTNLIVNAIRHSKGTKIRVSLSHNASHLILIVEDNGIGIEGEARKRIFERFYRADASRSSETGGAGLGLAIVQRIARLHCGTVAVEPATPSGCRFILTI